ncbi:glycosyltransferase [Corynebacterium liangguodongii]|uniref:Sugar transferase n=1 Tax=Corynebacterium liangguodongii TaxID=2079535 RepID=A0A2S0WH77_9CORY|nr:glycosyltransferase [Corynebacterium liangguodongii]AWB85125.1 sugar transferase [Corynebacterium liangguodongii]PWB98908.1 glycosyltransferase family 4 protein [Corynebacterium liangguodongii]
MTVTVASSAAISRPAGLRIAFVAPARYPIREPYAGGLEAFCHTMVKALRFEGHHVDLFAAKGSDGHCAELELPGVNWGAHPEEASDTGYPPGEREREDRAFVRLRRLLVRRGYDVVHNNSLNPWIFPSEHSPDHLPMITTLHTPVIDDLQRVIARAGAEAGEFAAVSHATAGQWRTPRPIQVIPNGVNVAEWTPGPGGTAAVWFGRLVPEKGPHLAIDACRLLGVPLFLAGRKGDHAYFEAEIAPRLRGGNIRWLGELSHAALRSLVGACAVTVVTPRWEEPFGLVAFESMACGTPVAAFARGGLGELLAGAPARLAEPDDVMSLARAIHAAMHVRRDRVREWVVANHSLVQTARRYTQLYQEAIVT